MLQVFWKVDVHGGERESEIQAVKYGSETVEHEKSLCHPQ